MSNRVNNEATQEMAEKENDAIVDALYGESTRLRRTAEGMRDDVKEHNKLLDTLSNTFDRATSGMKKTVGNLDQTMAKYGCKHTVAISVGIFLALLLLWYIFKAIMRSAPATPAPSA